MRNSLKISEEKKIESMIYITSGNVPSRAGHVLQVMQMASAFSQSVNRFKMLINVSIFKLLSNFSINDFYGIDKIKISKIPCSFNKDTFFPQYYKNKLFKILAPLYAKISKPSVVYTRDLVIARRCLKIGLRVVLEYHTKLPEDFFVPRVFKADNFLGCITISHQLRNSYISAGFFPDKILIEQDGVALKNFDIDIDKDVLRIELGIPQGKWINTYSGHLYDFKGIPQILEVAQKLNNDIFLVVGGWEHDIERLRIKCKKLNLNNVIIYGYVSSKKIPKILHASDLLLLPNSGKHHWSQDTSPLKLFEYMASGRPIIASNLNNISQVLEDGKNGILYKPDSVKDLVAKIQDVKSNKEAAIKLAAQAKIDVKRYDWIERANRILEFTLNQLSVNKIGKRSLIHNRLRYKYRVHHGGTIRKTGGPSVKLLRMAKYFPDFKHNVNIVYTVAGSVPYVRCLKLKKRGIPIIHHINSLYHPAYRKNYRERNKNLMNIYNMADYYVIGSRFAKKGIERYFGEIKKPYSIIYNAVDINHFYPSEKPKERCNILAIGKHYIKHRLEPIIRAMPYIIDEIPQACLIIAGELITGEGIFDCSKKTINSLISEAKVKNIKFIGRYTQKEAPLIYNKGDILVHTKHMDWTPNTVIEGMACGLPIVYSGNGGVHELIENSGISLSVPFDWDNIHEPSPTELASKIISAFKNKKKLGIRARELAVRNFSIEDWVRKHREIFDQFLN